MLTKIMVVEGHEDRIGIADLLSEYNVVTAYGGNDGLLMLENDADIGIVIVDVGAYDGLGLLKNLSSDDKYKDLRVIAITDDPGTEAAALALGAFDFMRKPVYGEALKKRIGVYLELVKVQQNFIEFEHGLNTMLNSVFEQAPVGIAILEREDPFTTLQAYSTINSTFARITGRSKEELMQINWVNITHPDDAVKDIELYTQMLEDKISNYTMEKRYIKPDGSYVWVHMAVAKLKLNKEFNYKVICFIQDISDIKALEEMLYESERSKSLLFANIPGLAYRCNYDSEYTMQFVSQRSYDVTGYPSESLVGNRDLSYSDLIAPEYRDFVNIMWQDAVARKVPFVHEYEIITASGQRKWVHERGQAIYDNLGNVEAIEGIIIDVSGRREQEVRVQYLNEHDELTGLYNRKYFQELLERDFIYEEEANKALFNVNLGKVDTITLAYGFQYSQQLLKRISIALSALCTNNRQLYSTYATRFTFYVKNYVDKDELIQFCGEIEKVLVPILVLEGIGASVGIIEICKKESDVKGILKNVLIASENALLNTDRLFSYSFFDQNMESEISRKMQIIDEIEQTALGTGKGIYMQYQPILDLNSNRICAFEALTRIRSKELGIISPLEFIPIAEETKLIVPLGKRILFHSLRFLKKVISSGHRSVKISVNVSAIQLLTEDFNPSLLELLKSMDIAPTSLIIEITESIFSDNYNEINRRLKELQALGVEVAIDDFGTGYSSLARERELNVNCMKMDKYFVDELLSGNPERAITSDIISMAHKLGHYVVAEGVEQELQLQYLQLHGCDRVQGYLISRPLDEPAALDLIKHRDGYNV